MMTDKNQEQFQTFLSKIGNPDLQEMETPQVNLREDYIDGQRTFYYSIEQNTPAWEEIRKGKITASNAQCLLTSPFTKTGKRSSGSIETLAKGAVTYAHKIALEMYCPDAANNEESYYSDDMARGHREEHDAAMLFELITGLTTDHCGFVSHGNAVGASPDRLIRGQKAGLEMKSAKSSVQWSRLLDQDSFVKEHYAQCQFSMYVTGYTKWYLTSYNPNFEDQRDKLLIKEIHMDLEIMKRFDDQVNAVIDLANEILNKKNNAA